MKDFFKKKRQKQVQVAPEPRSLEDIKKEHSELQVKVANAQYLSFVYSKETESLNQRLLEVNQEAGVRQALDKKASEAKAKQLETIGEIKNVES